MWFWFAICQMPYVKDSRCEHKLVAHPAFIELAVLNGGRLFRWLQAFWLLSHAFGHGTRGCVPGADEEPGGDKCDTDQPYPHDGERNVDVGVTGQCVAESCQVVLACGFDREHLRTVVECCSHDKQDRGESVRLDIIINPP